MSLPCIVQYEGLLALRTHKAFQRNPSHSRQEFTLPRSRKTARSVKLDDARSSDAMRQLVWHILQKINHIQSCRLTAQLEPGTSPPG